MLPVTVSITANTQVNVRPSTVVFTSDNWATPQELAVTAEDNRVDETTEHHTLWHSARSSDRDYNGAGVAFEQGSNVTVTIFDNDHAAVHLSKRSPSGFSGVIAVREGGVSGSYAVSLPREPMWRSPRRTVAHRCSARVTAVMICAPAH